MARTEFTYPSGQFPTTDKRDLLAFCGPTLEVDIGLDQKYDPDRPAVVPKLAQQRVRALVDTGATASYIDSQVARRLGLPQIDKETVTLALGGQQIIVTYLAHVHIPSLFFTLVGPFGGLDLRPLNVAAVLGREFLMDWKLKYDGTTGVVTLES